MEFIAAVERITRHQRVITSRLRITIISAVGFGKDSLQISTPQFGHTSKCSFDEYEQLQQDAILAPVQNIIEDKIKFSPNGAALDLRGAIFCRARVQGRVGTSHLL